MKTYVLDACALVAFFNYEEGADIVEDLLCKANNGECVVAMNKYNFLEVYYGYLRTNGEFHAETVFNAVEDMNIEIYDILTNEILREAGKLKVAHKISLADSVALAQAAVNNAAIVTSDHHEFDIVERETDIDFVWIR